MRFLQFAIPFAKLHAPIEKTRVFLFVFCKLIKWTVHLKIKIIRFQLKTKIHDKSKVNEFIFWSCLIIDNN